MAVTYYVVLPFIRTEDGVAPGEAHKSRLASSYAASQTSFVGASFSRIQALIRLVPAVLRKDAR